MEACSDRLLSSKPKRLNSMGSRERGGGRTGGFFHTELSVQSLCTVSRSHTIALVRTLIWPKTLVSASIASLEAQQHAAKFTVLHQRFSLHKWNCGSRGYQSPSGSSDYFLSHTTDVTRTSEGGAGVRTSATSLVSFRQHQNQPNCSPQNGLIPHEKTISFTLHCVVVFKRA